MPPALSNKKHHFGALLAIFSFLGFCDASYLTLEHYIKAPLPCPAFLNGCEQVTTSVYSTILGIPVALLGALYYVAILILSIAYFDLRRRAPALAKRSLIIAGYLTWIGFAASIIFVFIQAAVIHSYCIYCLGSAFTSTALFITGLFVIQLRKETN
jgi:uncharacterized membrane protein